MSDYPGAVQAIKDRLAANWTTTPIAYQNKPPAFSPASSDGKKLAPWVFLEVVCVGSDIIGAGRPGSQAWIYRGLIYVHVFTPVKSGDELAQDYAWQIGEIFRAKSFYDDTPPDIVHTWSPRTDGGDAGSDDGLWWRVTCTIPFDFYHRG